jgi:hypothetical protein
VARRDDVRHALDSLQPGRWLAVAVSGGVGADNGDAESFAAFLAQPAESLVVIDPVLAAKVRPETLAAVVEEALERPEMLALLVPPGDLPPTSGKNYGPIHSFAAPPWLLNGGPTDDADVLAPDRLCFRALRRVMNGAGASVVARECRAPLDDLPVWTLGETAARVGSTALIMAHRGPAELLETALARLCACSGAPEALRVGLDVDEEGLDTYRSITAAYPHVEFYVGPPAPVGPYVIRQALAALSTERFLVFHDSDDISTADRFHWLHAEIARNGPGVVGSHELRYDEDDREVRAVRFPLDATAALSVEPKHPQLHPTTMVATADFHRAGGFSTDCVFGNDTQFMLRAYFHLPLRNVDRFLYIRRDRWESLTNAPETGMENPLRIARNDAWRSDFESVKAGRMRLEGSSLMFVDGRAGWEPRRLYPSTLPTATDARPRRVLAAEE